MADKNFLNATAGVFQNSTKTVTFLPVPVMAEENNFGARISQKDTKVKITYLDFSTGRGDNARKAYANISYNNFLALYEASKRGLFEKVNFDLNEQKIMGNPMPNGPYKDMCRTTKLRVNMKEDKNGKPNWYIAIENGYANAIYGKNGSRTFDNRSYKVDVSGYVYISTENMHMYMHDCYMNIMNFANNMYDVHMQGLVHRYNLMMQEKGFYSNVSEIPKEASQEACPTRHVQERVPESTSEKFPIYTREEPITKNSAEVAETPVQTAPKLTSEAVTVVTTKTVDLPVQVIEKPFMKGGELAVKVLSRSANFNIYFPKGVFMPQAMYDSLEKQYAVTVKLNVNVMSNRTQKAYYNSVVA